MSNHSPKPDDEISKKMEQVFRKMPQTANVDDLWRRSQLGKTGEFPEGKMTPHDEGAIQFAIGAKDGKVVIEFATPVAWLGMQPEQAITLAESLIEKAARLGCIRPVKVRIE